MLKKVDVGLCVAELEGSENAHISSTGSGVGVEGSCGVAETDGPALGEAISRAARAAAIFCASFERGFVGVGESTSGGVAVGVETEGVDDDWST